MKKVFWYFIVLFLILTLKVFAADIVLWQENFDYATTTDLTNIWGPGIYRVTINPFAGIAAARNKIKFKISKGINEKRNGVLAPAFNPVKDWSSANELQMWIKVTNYPSTISKQVRIMLRLYNNETTSKITNESFVLTNIELKKWRLISMSTEKISQYLDRVTNIAIYYKRGNSDNDTNRFGVYYDELKVGKIAPIFLPSFTVNNLNGSTVYVTNLDGSNNYTNNMTVHLRIDIGEVKYPNQITADFSEIDSNFIPSNIIIITNKYRDYINGVYDIKYTISSGNSIWGTNKVVRIIARDRFGNGPTTNASFKLNIFTSLPFKLNLVSPASGSLIDSLTPNLIWNNNITNRTSFQLQVSSLADFSSLLINTNVVTTNYVIPIGYLSLDKTYYWRVRGVNFFGGGEWSSTNSFKTPSKVSVSTQIIINYFTNLQYIDNEGSIFVFPQGVYSSSENLSLTIETFILNESGFLKGYYLKPEDIIFDKSITIKFLIASSSLPSGKTLKDVVIKYYSNGEWVPLKSYIDGNYIVINTRFTGRFAAFIGVPVSNELSSVHLNTKVFSPNNDGENDVLIFNVESSLSPSNIKIYIYDIYGNLIKEINGDNPVWKGESNTGILPSGIYLYKVVANDKIMRGTFLVVNR